MKVNKECLYLKIQENVIIDFSLDGSEEADILRLFLSENEQLLFHCWESFVLPDSEVDMKTKEYIVERTRIKSKVQLFETVLHNHNEVSYWYEPINKEDLIKEISERYYDYICIVIEKGKDISCYKYLLSIEENYPVNEDEECRALLIREQIKGAFQSEIVPKIKVKFNNKLD